MSTLHFVSSFQSYFSMIADSFLCLKMYAHVDASIPDVILYPACTYFDHIHSANLAIIAHTAMTTFSLTF